MIRIHRADTVNIALLSLIVSLLSGQIPIMAIAVDDSYVYWEEWNGLVPDLGPWNCWHSGGQLLNY